MWLDCPRCKQPNDPFSVSPTQESGSVMARYRCRFCTTRYRDTWAVASHHFWLGAGGRLAAEYATPLGVTFTDARDQEGQS